MEKDELLWRQYELNVKLYGEYLGLVLKMNIFYYAVTGAILSYYFSHPEQSLAKYGLFLPLAMSVALAFLFSIGAHFARYTRQDTFALRDALGLEVAPEILVLILLLIIFAILMVLVAVGLSYLIFWK